MFDMQMFLLDTAVQTAEVEMMGPGTAIIPVAIGFLAAMGVCGFFIRYAMKKGEYDRRHDPERFLKKR